MSLEFPFLLLMSVILRSLLNVEEYKFYVQLERLNIDEDLKSAVEILPLLFRHYISQKTVNWRLMQLISTVISDSSGRSLTQEEYEDESNRSRLRTNPIFKERRFNEKTTVLMELPIKHNVYNQMVKLIHHVYKTYLESECHKESHKTYNEYISFLKDIADNNIEALLVLEKYNELSNFSPLQTNTRLHFLGKGLLWSKILVLRSTKPRWMGVGSTRLKYMNS